MAIQKILKDKRNDILKIAEKHGAYNIRVFGSQARGDTRPDSDIDFLVEVGDNHSPFFPGGLLVDLEDLLGRKVDIITEDALHWYIKDKVIKEAVPL